MAWLISPYLNSSPSIKSSVQFAKRKQVHFSSSSLPMNAFQVIMMRQQVTKKCGTWCRFQMVRQHPEVTKKCETSYVGVAGKPLPEQRNFSTSRAQYPKISRLYPPISKPPPLSPKAQYPKIPRLYLGKAQYMAFLARFIKSRDLKVFAGFRGKFNIDQVFEYLVGGQPTKSHKNLNDVKLAMDLIRYLQKWGILIGRVAVDQIIIAAARDGNHSAFLEAVEYHNHRGFLPSSVEHQVICSCVKILKDELELKIAVSP